MISILMDQMTSTRFGIDCQDCQIRHKAICANSDADELAKLNSFKTYTRYQPDEMITYSGDPLDYVGTLVTGMAEISMALEDGRRQILGLLSPGDFIGRPDRLYCKYDIKALDEIEFCRFDRKDFRSLLARSPSLSQRLYEMTMYAARVSADIILLNGRLDILPDVLNLSKVARLRMLQNFGLAALYNLITIPLAFSGFATPLMAALAMSLSSITVTLNAFRLPKINKDNAPDVFKFQKEKTP